MFRDIDLEDHLEWGRERCRAARLEPYFPLWQERRKKLVYEIIDAGFQPVITVVNTKWMATSFLGETLIFAKIKFHNNKDMVYSRLVELSHHNKTHQRRL